MGAALHHRLSGVQNPRLPGWITLSVLAHLLVLSTSGGIAPFSAPYRAPLTVDIQHITPEITEPAAVAGLKPEIESQRAVPEQSQSDALAKTIPAETPPQAAVELPLPLDTYFNAGDVDVRAEPVNEVLLYYPLNPYYRRIGGVVTVSLFINAQGGLDKVDLIGAKPSGLFEEAALAAVNKLKFSPAQKNGRPVKSRKTIDVMFDPYESVNIP